MQQPSPSAVFRIFHAEDDQSDANLVKRVLRDFTDVDDYYRFETGDELLKQLFDTDPSDLILPDVILLDISLPGTTGKEILKQLRQQAKTSKIPIIMLSGSNSERDFCECIESGCNGYLIKSSDWDYFKPALTSFLRSWQSIKSQKFV